jgi:hypothetical protein
VASIYRGLTETLLPMARESVLAHLLKLEREGRARRAGDAARPQDAARPDDAWHMMEP